MSAVRCLCEKPFESVSEWYAHAQEHIGEDLGAVAGGSEQGEEIKRIHRNGLCLVHIARGHVVMEEVRKLIVGPVLAYTPPIDHEDGKPIRLEDIPETGRLRLKS